MARLDRISTARASQAGILQSVMTCVGPELAGPDEDMQALVSGDLGALQVATRLRKMGWLVSQAHVQQAATPRELAAMIAGGGSAKRTVWPASPAQEQLWLLDQIDGAGPLYNVAWSAKIEGPLKTEALREAVLYLVRRHPALDRKSVV